MPDTTTYLSLTDAAKLAPGRPHVSTVWRWCLKGTQTPAGKIKLRYVRAGKQIFTTAAWMQEYYESLAEADASLTDDSAPEVQNPRSNTRRDREISRAEAQLQAAGV